MTDVYRPNDDAAPEAPPAETVELISKEAVQQEAIKQGVPLDLDKPFSPDEVAELANKGRTSRDDLLAREMSRDLNRQREREGHINDLPPLVEVKAPRGKDSYKDVRELTSDMTFNRRLNVRQQALEAGHDERTAEAIAMRDGQFEPQAPTLIDDKGRVISELGRSMEAGDTTFSNVHEATRALRLGREADAAQLQADLAEYQPTSAEQQIQPEPAPVSSPVEVPQPQGPSPEVLAQHQALQRQQNALLDQAAWLQLSTEERSLVTKNAQWDNWLRSVPEATSWEAWQATRENHPQRFAQIVKGFEQARNAKAAISRRAGELTEIRQNRANQYRAAQEAQLTARNDQWDKEAYQYLRTLPEFNRDKAALRRVAGDVIKSATGWNDQQLDWEWNYGNTIRAPAAQRMIAQNVRLRMAEEATTPERLAARRRNNAPQPLAPGAWMPSSNDYSAEIATLNRRLEAQSGLAALKTAKELTQARRKAGLL